MPANERSKVLRRTGDLLKETATARSGIGRENGQQAIKEFTNLMTVGIHSCSNRAWFLDATIREGMTPQP